MGVGLGGGQPIAAAGLSTGDAIPEPDWSQVMTEPARDPMVQLRWRTLVENLPPLIWCADANGKWTWASPQWSAVTGQSVKDSLGDGWLDVVHPDDRARAVMAWIGARDGAIMAVDFRIFDRAEGRFRWHTTRATPVWDRHDGAIVEWIGASTDTDALHQAQHRQQALIEALDHRVRNTLSSVRAMVRQAASETATADELGLLLLSRIDTLARVQLLAGSEPEPFVNLATVVSDEIAALGYLHADGIAIVGDALNLPLRKGELIALTVHELLADAARRGSLTARDSSITLSWRIRSDGAARVLHFRWLETGRHRAVAPGGNHGFSGELLHRTLAHELNARTRVAANSGRLDIEIMMPL